MFAAFNEWEFTPRPARNFQACVPSAIRAAHRLWSVLPKYAKPPEIAGVEKIP